MTTYDALARRKVCGWRGLTYMELYTWAHNEQAARRSAKKNGFWFVTSVGKFL